MDYIELGLRIREIRLQNHMTQAILAEKAGISTSFIGHIERGSRIASLDTFVRLCEALDVSPNDLLHVGSAQDLERLPEKQREQLQALLQRACQLVQGRP